MLPQWPKGFRVLFVAVMLLFCLTCCVTMVWQVTMTEQLRMANLQLEATEARLKKQQVEYEQYQQLLPETQAQLAEIRPQADEISAREQELRSQRKALRAENAQQAEMLSALEAEYALLSQPDDAQLAGIATMQNALQTMRDDLAQVQELLQ